MAFLEFLKNTPALWRRSSLPALCAASLLAATTAFADIPRGVFNLLPGGGTAKDATLSNPDVDGVSIRGGWIDIEPTEGSFNWTYLDSEVGRASAAGKQVILRVSTQANKPAWVTQAVTAAGGLFYTFVDNGVTTTIPVFWDPTYLAKKKAMIAALGAHFTHNSAVKIVAASFANATSEDWNVPHTPEEVTKWLALGYTSEKMLDAGKQIIDATMVAFPNQFVTLAVAGNGNLDPDSDYVARNAVATANVSWPGRLIVQKNCLSATNPAAPGIGTVFQMIWDNQPNVGAQMLWWCYGDLTYRNNNGAATDPAIVLHNSINIAASYGIKFVEIYQTDVINLPIEISYAHDVLTGISPPTPPPPPGDAPQAPTGLRVGS